MTHSARPLSQSDGPAPADHGHALTPLAVITPAPARGLRPAGRTAAWPAGRLAGRPGQVPEPGYQGQLPRAGLLPRPERCPGQPFPRGFRAASALAVTVG